MIPTPNTDHTKLPQFSSVYEPAEDTFILLDALEQDIELIEKSRIVLEIGSGSGCVSAFVGKIISPNQALLITTDLNPAAALCTLKTSKLNSLHLLEPVIADLTDSLLPRLCKGVDILIFNPPYVETYEEEMHEAQQGKQVKEGYGGIEKAWAGGSLGMTVTNRLLQKVNELLSESGTFYLVAVPQNQPEEIIRRMRIMYDLNGKIVLERRAGREFLKVIRFSR